MLAHRTLIALLLALAVLASACGGDDTTATTDEEATEEEAEETEEPEEEAEEPTEEEAEEPTEEATEVAEDPKDREDLAPPPADAPPPPPPPAPLPTETPLSSPMDLADAAIEMDSGGSSTYDSYTGITDDTGAIFVEVPSEWGEVDGRPYTDEQGRTLYDVRAAGSLEGFQTTWTEPGIIVTASTEVAQSENEVTLLDQLVGPLSGACTYSGRAPYEDPLYTGQVDIYEDCGGTDADYVVLAAVPDTRAFVIRVEVQVVEERDLEALERALATFVVTGDV